MFMPGLISSLFAFEAKSKLILDSQLTVNDHPNFAVLFHCGWESIWLALRRPRLMYLDIIWFTIFQRKHIFFTNMAKT